MSPTNSPVPMSLRITSLPLKPSKVILTQPESNINTCSAGSPSEKMVWRRQSRLSYAAEIMVEQVAGERSENGASLLTNAIFSLGEVGLFNLLTPDS